MIGFRDAYNDKGVVSHDFFWSHGSNAALSLQRGKSRFWATRLIKLLRPYAQELLAQM